jgi:hypothetical protein
VKVRFLEIAEIELDQAVHWYGAQAPGLGDAFLIEMLSATDRIARFPEAWHSLGEGVRRCHLSRFPYGCLETIAQREPMVKAFIAMNETGARRRRWFIAASKALVPRANACV